MPQTIGGVVVDDAEYAELSSQRQDRIRGELDGIEKLQSAVLAINVRYATRALVDQAAADGELPLEIERLAAGIRERVERLRAELATLRTPGDVDLVPSPLVGAAD